MEVINAALRRPQADRLEIWGPYDAFVVLQVPVIARDEVRAPTKKDPANGARKPVEAAEKRGHPTAMPTIVHC